MDEGAGESGAMVFRINVEFAEFGRGGSWKTWVRVAEGDDHVGDDALSELGRIAFSDGSEDFSEEDDDVGVVNQGEEARGR